MNQVQDVVSMKRKLLAESIGTFFLVFFGTGAIVITEHTGGVPGHIGIAATFGGIVMVLIYAFGKISGGHFNPAVSMGFWINKQLPFKMFSAYIFVQLFGAIVASVLIKQLFPENELLGATIPSGSITQSFILEFILTFLLMLVILKVADGSRESDIIAALAIGGTVFIEAIFAGPICGASMNPFRSLAPALVGSNLSSSWIYIVAPILGALSAVFISNQLNETK